MRSLAFVGLLLACPWAVKAQTTTFNGIVKDLTNTPVPTGLVTFQLKPGVDTTISGNARFTSTTVNCEIHNPAVVSTSGTGTITVVVGTAQTWQVGDSLIFVGTADATLNGSTVASPYTITTVNSTTSFNFTQSGTHTNGAGGTVGGLYKSGGTGACAVTQNLALTPANTSYNVGLWPLFSLTSSFNTYAIGAGPVDISTVVPTPGQMPAYSFVDMFSNQTIGGTKTFTGTLNANGALNATGGGSLAGTFTGNPILSGNPNFTGTPIFVNPPFFGNTAFKGPIPWADITANGARAGTAGATITQTNSGSAVVTLSTGASQFQNGDGVVLPGVGAANAMTTPVAPTVTPSEASGPTGTENDVASPTGSSTYKYCYFAIDTNENVTACSPTTTITNGLSALGLQTATLTTYSRTNDVATYNTSASTNLAVNAYVDIIPNSPQFTGWYQVCSTPSGTQFTVCGTEWDTRVGVNQVSDVGTATVSGGTVSYYQDNKVVLTAVAGAWLYGVCAARPADGSTLHLIGLTKPQGGGSLNDLQFDDYGATYHGNQTYPSWLSDSNCTGAASTNGLLSTTISSGGGTANIVLAANANATVTSGTMNLDACPGLKAATAAAQQTGLAGAVYIPPIIDSGGLGRVFNIKSYCALPTNGGRTVSIKIGGGLSLDQTLQLQGNTNIDGSFGEQGAAQFGNYAGAAITVNSVLPGIYASNQGVYLSMLNITGASQNGDMLIVTDNANGFTLDGVNCVSAGQNANDLLGMCMLNRDSSGTVVDLTVRNSLFSGGPTQTTDLSWTPLVWQKVGSFYNSWTHNNNNRRGVVLTNSSTDVKWYYSQGLINPQFTFFPSGNTSARFDTVYHDTDGQPTISAVGNQALGNYSLKNIQAGSNPPNPIISGARPQATFAEQTFFSSGVDVTPNRGTCKNGVWTTPAYPWDTSGSYNAGNEAMTLCSEPIGITSGSPIFWALAPPTAITATVSAGGSIPVSASGLVYSVSATGPDGGETILQPVPSSACVTSTGNQTCTVGYTLPAGAASANVYRCDKSLSTCTAANLGGIIGTQGGWTQVVLHTTSNPYVDTLASTTSVPALPAVTATGYPEILGGSSAGIYTPFISQQGPLTTTITQTQQVAGDTQNRFRILANGGMTWNDGSHSNFPCAMTPLPGAGANAGLRWPGCFFDIRHTATELGFELNPNNTNTVGAFEAWTDGTFRWSGGTSTADARLTRTSAALMTWDNPVGGSNVTIASNGPSMMTITGFTPVNQTQSATQASTTLYAVPSTGAGIYLIEPYIETTTAGTAGTATLAFSYVNQSGVTVNLTCATINLAGLGSNLGTATCSSPLMIYSAASQNISYSVTNSGSTGTWTARLRLGYLN